MKSLGLAIGAGLLFALSLPPYNQEWLGWVALAPLLVAAHARRPLEAVGLGLVAGLTGGLLHARWNVHADSLLLGYLPFLWLAMFFGVVALAGRTARLRGWNGRRWIGFVACAGVASEWLTTFSPLPLNIALSQYRNLFLIQIASVTGIWGVSFLLWLVNAALADSLLAPRAQWRPLGVTLAAVLLTLSWGAGAVSQVNATWKDGGPHDLRVAAIQDFSAGEAASVLPENKDTDAEGPDRDAMTRQAVGRGAKLVVWSEECQGSAFTPDDPADTTNTLARQNKAYIVVGYSDGHQPRPYNCAALVGPKGRTLGVHHKMRLFMGERQVVEAGTRARAFPTPLGRVGMEICFDSLYTGVTRQIARDGAQIVAMPNFDPPTPNGVLHELHSAVLPFRAVENRVPFVRTDSNGDSQIVDVMGRVVAQAPLWKADVLVGDVALGEGRGTLFSRWGDWLAYLCVLFFTAGTIRLVQSRRKMKWRGEHIQRRGEYTDKESGRQAPAPTHP